MAMLSSCGHGCDEFLTRTTMVAVSPSTSCFFLGSSSSSSSSGSQMLSFSSNSDAVASMQGVWARLRGPFTPTQWMELEHQALIYKHIVANAPVPASLLIPIRRSLHPWSTLASSPLGWGAFHLGCADAEPGRCRRTDGKKWRCSRDAVLDQKYCERHINRGRHRSRKHVEGRKAMPAIAEPASVVAGSRSSGSHAAHAMARQMLVKDLADNVTPCPTQLHRMLLDKRNVVDQVQDSTTFPMSNFMNQKSKDIGMFEETSSQVDYAAASSGSLMNSPQTEDLNSVPQSTLNEQSQLNSIRHFFDEELQSDMTQLSVPIPMDSSDFSSPHASPNHEKLTLSPLKLPHGHDQAHIAPGAGSSYSSDEGNKAQASWVAVSWETLVDGPLGEVFKSKRCPSASLNLLTDGWTASPQLHSPTGVLQTTTNFSSMSSSTVSSPTSLVKPQTAPTL